MKCKLTVVKKPKYPTTKKMVLRRWSATISSCRLE